MAWVVDSCILLDVAENDPAFGIASARLLDRLSADGLLACPVSIVEIAPQFGGNLGDCRRFLSGCGISDLVAWTWQDTESSFEGWNRYVAMKKAGGRKRPVAALLIGGFAVRFQGLVTRNRAHFAPYYPRLEIVSPE